MSKNSIILLFFLFSCGLPPQEKCAEIKPLLVELTKLRDSSSLAPAKRIELLPEYETKLKECNGHFDSTHTLVLRRMGDIYDSASYFENGIELYQRSIALIEAHINDPSTKPRDLVPAYYKVSLLNHSLNRTSEKMTALDSCAFIAMRLKYIDLHCLSALYQMTEHAFHIGDYNNCITYSSLCATLALEYAEKGNANEKADGIHYAKSSLEWQVNALLALKRVDQAKKILETKVTEFSNMAQPGDIGFVYGMLGDVFLREKDYEKALAHYNRSFELLAQAPGQAGNCKATLNLIGFEIYFKYLNDKDKALQFFKKALDYPVPHKDKEDSVETLSIYSRIGNVFLNDGKYDIALQYFQKAFDQIETGINESALLQSSFDEILGGKKRGHIVTLIFNKGETYRQKYKVTRDLKDLTKAIEIFKVEDQFLERIKTDQSDAKSKLFWLSDRRKLYELAIDACYANGNMEDAFYFFERSRAVLLYDQLKEQKLISEEDLTTQAQLKKDAAQLEKKFGSLELDSPEKALIQRQLVVTKKELDKIENKLKFKNPLYEQGYFEVGSDLLKTVQQQLAKNKEQLIEFFDGDSSAFVLTITPDKLFLQKLRKESFNKSIDEYVKYLSDRQLLNRDFKGFVNTSNELYRLIFEKQPPQSGKIIVSPDSRYFPVEALLTNANGEKLTYLIEAHPVSYSHSARLLVGQADPVAENTSRNFLGVAPVNFNSSLKQVSLAGSDESLEKLQSSIPRGRSRTLGRATKENFLKEFSQYMVLQLYTHASDGKGEGEPEIYFADSILYLSDLVSDRKPVTRLIVLSACETGTGQWHGGEGVFSFNRGFAALGIPSSITNLWRVENKSTYRLTELFYKHLLEETDIDIALQRAKLEFIKTGTREEQMPYYWASAILAGKTDPIQFDRSFRWDSMFWIIAGIVFTLMIATIWSNYKRARMTMEERKIPNYSFS